MGKMPVKADLGCGENKMDGALGVDRIDTKDVDIVQDLNKMNWDLPDNHFQYVRCKDIFEHLQQPVRFVENLYDIMKPGGVVEIITPHQASQNWTDPTHKRLAGVDTFQYYFTEDGEYSYYSNAEFSIEKVFIHFPRKKIFPWNYILEKFVNYNRETQRFFENSLWSNIFSVNDIRFQLKKPEGDNS